NGLCLAASSLSAAAASAALWQCRRRGAPVVPVRSGVAVESGSSLSGFAPFDKSSPGAAAVLKGRTDAVEPPRERGLLVAARDIAPPSYAGVLAATARGQILACLFLSDLFASLGILARSVAWLTGALEYDPQTGHGNVPAACLFV